MITLADRMDAGLVLAMSERPIDPLVTAGELHDLLARTAPRLPVLGDHARGAWTRVQDESLVTHAPSCAKDGAIDFAWDAGSAAPSTR